METWVGNHHSHGVVIAGVSCVAGKFWIINVVFSTPNDLSENWDAPFALSSGIKFIGFPISISHLFSLSIYSLPTIHKNNQKNCFLVLSPIVPIISFTDSFCWVCVLCGLCRCWYSIMIEVFSSLLPCIFMFFAAFPHPSTQIPIWFLAFIGLP
jgi:hypothetical protein